jgi:hypothetical protein
VPLAASAFSARACPTMLAWLSNSKSSLSKIRLLHSPASGLEGGQAPAGGSTRQQIASCFSQSATTPQLQRRPRDQQRVMAPHFEIKSMQPASLRRTYLRWCSGRAWPACTAPRIENSIDQSVVSAYIREQMEAAASLPSIHAGRVASRPLPAPLIAGCLNTKAAASLRSIVQAGVCCCVLLELKRTCGSRPNMYNQNECSLSHMAAAGSESGAQAPFEPRSQATWVTLGSCASESHIMLHSHNQACSCSPTACAAVKLHQTAVRDAMCCLACV